MAKTSPATSLLKSGLCTQAQLLSDSFQTWNTRIGEAPKHLHRKVWEWCFIAEALSERNLLRPNMRGLGFAVGQEPLSALFASYGCTIVATDLAEDAAREGGWVDTNQHASHLDVLNKRGLCPPDAFRRLVSFQNADMNHIPENLHGFDFIWSSCSLEHLGSLNKGEQFIYNAMRCLKPGGIAIHTTEFNISSNTSTIDNTDTVLYRRCDIENIARELTKLGHHIELDLREGDGYADQIVDLPPYKHDIHLRLKIGEYVTTSVGLIIQKQDRFSAKKLIRTIFQR